MTLQLFLGVRLPDQPYFRVPVYDVDSNKSVHQLKMDVEPVVKQSKDTLEFIYCGKVLIDDETLQEQKIRNNSTIHVLQKKSLPVIRDMTLTEAEIVAAHEDFNDIADPELFCSYPILPEPLKCILDKYPEFHQELGALAILKTPTLLMNLRELEFTHKIAATYPILIKASTFIVQVYNRWMNGYIQNFPLAARADDSSSSEDGEMVRVMPENQISQDQLANALMLAGSSSVPNASNQLPIGNTVDSIPSTSNVTSTPGAQRITSAALNNALQNAFRGSNPAVQSAEPAHAILDPAEIVPSTQSPAASPQSNANPLEAFIQQSRPQFASELLVMREIGLTDEARNIQVLILCDGDVERAINLLMSASN